MSSERSGLQGEVFDITIRLGALALLVAACFWILAPFLMAVAWGAIIAVAVHPVFRWLFERLGGRDRLAAGLVTVGLLAALLVPTVFGVGSLWSGAQLLADEAHTGALDVPPPPAWLASWPVVGEELYDTWALASSNLEAVLQRFAPQIREAVSWLLSTAAGTGFTVLQFLLSIAISGVLLARADASARAAIQFSRRLAGDEGEAYAGIAAATVQSVTRGVLGVAFIQAALAGPGFALAGVPAPGLLTLLCLIVGVMQLPIAIVTVPAAFYVVSTAGTVTSALFVLWMVLVTPADNVLKPILLGRGAPVPTMIIFLGSMGGFVGAGLIGLFVGAVVLSLGYILYEAWLE